MERKENARDPDPFARVDNSFFGFERPPERAIVEAGRYARESENDPYRIVAALPVKVFVTTAWTDLLQEALRARGRTPITLTFPWSPKFKYWRNEFPEWAKSASRKEPTVDEPLVYHLFGRLEEPRSLVLTEDDYFDWLTAWNASKDIPGMVPPRVKNACANSLLFLGYYLDDWDFRVVFQSIKTFAMQIQDNRHIGVQMRPRGQIVEREAAQRYLDSYFKESKISIFWVSTASFVTMLKERLDLRP
jgi:SIR2-like protein